MGRTDRPVASDGRDDAGPVAGALAAILPALDPGATGIAGLERLAGGASKEIWGFHVAPSGRHLVVRRAPPGRPAGSGLGLSIEAGIAALAHAAGVPTPPVLYRFAEDSAIGEAFVMGFVDGETLPGRIFREPGFAVARRRAAADLGQALARIHAVPAERTRLPHLTPAGATDRLAMRLAATGEARPVFELALRQLADTVPPGEACGPHVVHGDFRMGNLIFAPDGLAAVLDWELAFIGDRHADFGWFCMESWRFGGDGHAGGLCSREALARAYEAAGGAPVSDARMDWWELWSALHWGIITREMAGWIDAGTDRSVERHVIARRASETELVLLNAMAGARADA